MVELESRTGRENEGEEAERSSDDQADDVVDDDEWAGDNEDVSEYEDDDYSDNNDSTDDEDDNVDDDEDEEENEEEEDRKQAEWKDLFIQVCVRIARNDPTLVHLERWSKENVSSHWEWDDSDLMLLGRSLVGNTHLRSLAIDMDPDPPCYAGEALQQGIAESRLQLLVVNGLSWELQKTVLMGVAKAPSLQQLRLSDMRLDLRYIANLLVPDFVRIANTERLDQLHNKLTHLSLRGCGIESGDMLSTFSMALASNGTITSLDLRDNDIRDVGVTIFCRNWISGSQLQELNLSNIAIGPKGMTLLFDRLKSQNLGLRTLALSGNEAIGYQGLSVMGAFLPHIRLQTLRVSKCVTRSERTSESSRAAREAACHSFVQGLRGNTSLCTLHIGNNALGARGIEILMQAIAVHPSLECLSLKGDTSIRFAGIKLLGAMLPQVKLTCIILDGIVHPITWPDDDDTTTSSKKVQTAARQAGRALLEGVQHNHSLTSFQFDELPGDWMHPIQFYMEANQACRPLFSNGITSAIWPYVMAHFHRKDKLSHLYFCLLEQPWLIASSKMAKE